MAGMTGQRYNNGAVLPVKPPYGVCSSEADTQVKAVVVPSISALEAGLFILVKFSNAQTYDGVPKLNVNGLGAKDIKTNGTTGAARYEWNAGEVLSFYYDGTNWLIVRDGTASTTYYGKTKLTNAVDSDSETLAASAKAVKTVADQLAGKLSASDKGAAGGVAELDATGKVPASQLPSYVDDVLEFASLSNFPATGENGKIYIATDTNKQYRWSGTQYVEIASSLALGETSATAYRGDRGKAAYDHATDAYKVSSAQTEALYKVSVTSEGHVGSVTPVQKSDITALGIPGSDTDTKNTAGTVNKAGEKMFLVGATTQGANPETNSNSKVFIGTDNELYSNEKKVAHAEDIKQMTGASASAAGTAGYVLAPGIGDQNKFLKGDGTWGEVQVSEIDDTAGTGDTNKTWSADKITEELENVSVPVMTGASASAAGTSGTVPAPGIGDQDKFFRGDGTWADAQALGGTLRTVPFSIGANSWTLANGVYMATYQTAYVTASSVEFVEYTDSFRNAIRGDLNWAKASGNGGITFTTDVAPVGTLEGELRILDSDDGRTSVVLQGTVMPIANGGTGANTLAGAKANLGISDLEEKIEDNDLAIIERGDTATHSIAEGKYVSWKGKIGKAKSAIQQGATLSSSLFDYDDEGALNALNASLKSGISSVAFASGVGNLQHNLNDATCKIIACLTNVASGAIFCVGNCYNTDANNTRLTAYGFDMQPVNGTFDVIWIGVCK